MKLVLLVGGKGTRLGDLTKDVPKPMLPIAGKPVLEHTIEWAKSQGLDDVIICSGYLSNVIEEHFSDGSKYGVKIKYSIEDKPLGSGGPLYKIKDFLGEPFFVLNGDVLCKVDAQKMYNFHNEKNSVATIAIQDSHHPHDSDLIEINNIGKVVKFWFKPHATKPNTDKSIAGLCLFDPKVTYHLHNGSYSLEQHFLKLLFNMGYNVYGYHTNEYLEDMGTPERMKKAEEEFSKP